MPLSWPATQTTPVSKPLGASAHRVWPPDGGPATVCIMMMCIRAAVIVGCATPTSHVASSWRTREQKKQKKSFGSLCLTKRTAKERAMDRGRTLKMNRGSGLLVLSAVAAGLGNSLDSISVLSFIAPALALLSLACLTSFEWVEHRGGSPVPTGPLPWRISSGDVPSVARTDARVAYAYALFIGAQSLGFALGFAAALVPDMPLATSVIGVWVCGLGIWSLMTGLVYLPTLRLWARLGPESLLRVYVFPLLHATVSIAIIGRTISTFQVSAASVVDIAPLRMLGSVFGLIGIDWVVSLSAALISEHTLFLVAPTQASLLVLSPRALPRASFLALGQLMLLLVVGGIFEKAPGMWQETIAQQVASSSSINASCLIHRRQPSGGEDGGWMGEQTALRIAALDDIVVWSEEAAVVETEAEEDTLISSVRAMLAGSAKTYVALNYLKKVGVYGNYSNLSVLMCPKGKIAWYKAKAYPVPVVEAEVCEYL